MCKTISKLFATWKNMAKMETEGGCSDSTQKTGKAKNQDVMLYYKIWLREILGVVTYLWLIS